METKTEIIEQTFDLTMKYGIKSVSMDDIARNLGMSKKTIYQHFENKKELVREMVISTVSKDEADIKSIIVESKDAMDEIINIAQHMLQFLREMSPSLVYDMQKYYVKEWQRVEDHHHRFIYQVIKDNIERGIAEGYYLDDLNADVVAKLYVSMSHTLTDESVFPLKEYSKSDLYKILITYHMRGVISPKGKKYLDKINID